MADFSLKLKADALQKSLENLPIKVEQEINQAVKNLANAAYTSMVAQIQAKRMSNNSRSAYLKGLKFKELGDDSYLIYLDGEEANKIESGSGPQDLREVLLASTSTVSAGSRIGQSWVQTNKAGKKYAHVPFEHKTTGVSFSSGNLADDIKKAGAINAKGLVQSMAKTFTDIDGNPVKGRVASTDIPGSPDLKGLTKYQHVSPKGKVTSLYLTFRTISESVSGGWMLPARDGMNLFVKTEKYIEEQLELIVKTLL
jgi:hypothetical protein